MKSTDLVFIDVDTQRDFCEPDGALYVDGAPISTFRVLTQLAVDKKIPIVGSVDSHGPNAWEFGSNENVGPEGEDPGFPDHCVKGTPGWLKVQGTAPAKSAYLAAELGDYLGPDAVADALIDNVLQAVYLEKEVYSLFANTLAAELLEALGCRTAVVYGVATDYCVKAAALGLRERGYEVIVLQDAIAAVTPGGGRSALAEMQKAGCRFMDTTELIAILS